MTLREYHVREGNLVNGQWWRRLGERPVMDGRNFGERPMVATCVEELRERPMVATGGEEEW